MPHNKVDSNATGLRFAEEATLGVLPGTPDWYPLEPNSYDDFGGEITTIARNPINPSRQRKKGVVTDLDATGGFEQDVTQTNLRRALQGFFFADMREKATTDPINGTITAITNVDGTGNDYEAASGLDIFAANDLVLASGFNEAQNNGLKTVTTAAAASLTVSETVVDETPPAGAKIEQVGVVGAAGDIDVDAAGSLPALTSTTLDFTTLGFIVGEWIFIGGDAAGTAFANAENNGFARIRSIAANRLEFDKTASTMVTEASTTETIQLFFGNVIRNEPLPANIVRRSYQIERTLGDDDNGTMSEYLVGAVANELTLTINTADKALVSLAYIAIDNEQRDGATGVKSGNRPALVDKPAFNTSSDFSRLKMGLVDTANSNVTPLFAFLTDLTVTINNNVSPNKAVSVLGAFDVTAGTFEVGGSLEAYFADIAAVQAVRNNSDVTIDMALVKDNAGMVWDLPLIALGDGRLNVEQDEPIKLPLETNAAESVAGHTLLWNEFPYLPNLADV